MIEGRIYAGKCKCNRELDMRIIDLKEDEDNPESKIIGWIIYGFCKKCDVVHAQGMFKQEERPVLDRDFFIDYNKVVVGK